MDCSTPGFSDLHCLPEFAQTHSIESVMPFNSEYSGGSVWPLFVLPHFQDILSCLLHPKHVFIFIEGRKFPPQDQKEGLECSLVPFLIISALSPKEGELT